MNLFFSKKKRKEGSSPSLQRKQPNPNDPLSSSCDPAQLLSSSTHQESTQTLTHDRSRIHSLHPPCSCASSSGPSAYPTHIPSRPYNVSVEENTCVSQPCRCGSMTHTPCSLNCPDVHVWVARCGHHHHHHQNMSESLSCQSPNQTQHANRPQPHGHSATPLRGEVQRCTKTCGGPREHFTTPCHTVDHSPQGQPHQGCSCTTHSGAHHEAGAALVQVPYTHIESQTPCLCHLRGSQGKPCGVAYDVNECCKGYSQPGSALQCCSSRAQDVIHGAVPSSYDHHPPLRHISTHPYVVSYNSDAGTSRGTPIVFPFHAVAKKGSPLMFHGSTFYEYR